MSTGATLALAATKRGLSIIAVWSDVCPEELRLHMKHQFQVLGTVVHEKGRIGATCAALKKIGRVTDVFCGSEPGVELADELSTALGLRGNGDVGGLSGVRQHFISVSDVQPPLRCVSRQQHSVRSITRWATVLSWRAK